MKRSLYQCLEAQCVGGFKIKCAQGRELTNVTVDGSISFTRLEEGKALEMAVCTDCPDYDEMGPPIPREERGWLDNLDQIV